MPRKRPEADKRLTHQDRDTRDYMDGDDGMAGDHTSDNTERYPSTLIMEKIHTLEVEREERRRQEQHEAGEELASRELAFKLKEIEIDSSKSSYSIWLIFRRLIASQIQGIFHSSDFKYNTQ